MSSEQLQLVKSSGYFYKLVFKYKIYCFCYCASSVTVTLEETHFFGQLWLLPRSEDCILSPFFTTAGMITTTNNSFSVHLNKRVGGPVKNWKIIYVKGKWHDTDKSKKREVEINQQGFNRHSSFSPFSLITYITVSISLVISHNNESFVHHNIMMYTPVPETQVFGLAMQLLNSSQTPVAEQRHTCLSQAQSFHILTRKGGACGWVQGEGDPRMHWSSAGCS